MKNIPDKFAFQPFSQTLNKWLYTRKGDLNEGDFCRGIITNFLSDYTQQREVDYITVLAEL